MRDHTTQNPDSLLSSKFNTFKLGKYRVDELSVSNLF